MKNKIHSCKGHSDQVFCNDPACGRRDSSGQHFPMGHVFNKFMPKHEAEWRKTQKIDPLQK